jgi:hypothetical protein
MAAVPAIFMVELSMGKRLLIFLRQFPTLPGKADTSLAALSRLSPEPSYMLQVLLWSPG